MFLGIKVVFDTHLYVISVVHFVNVYELLYFYNLVVQKLCNQSIASRLYDHDHLDLQIISFCYIFIIHQYFFIIINVVYKLTNQIKLNTTKATELSWKNL